MERALRGVCGPGPGAQVGLGFYDPKRVHRNPPRDAPLAVDIRPIGCTTLLGTCGYRPERADLSASEAPTLPLSLPNPFARFATPPIATASIMRTSPEGSPAHGRPTD